MVRLLGLSALVPKASTSAAGPRRSSLALHGESSRAIGGAVRETLQEQRALTIAPLGDNLFVVAA
jgi:hypothetical protein